MGTIGDEFAALVHFSHLKPLGFLKTRHTFARNHDEYAEHYQIQGSAWNTKDHPWICYLNCGINFSGFPRRSPDGDFPRTHAWMRGEYFVPGAKKQYAVTSENMVDLAAELAQVILQCSQYFGRRHRVLLRAYEEKKYECGFLDDPELRRDE